MNNKRNIFLTFRRFLPFLVWIYLAYSCAPKATTSVTKINEDLTVYRDSAYVVAKEDISEETQQKEDTSSINILRTSEKIYRDVDITEELVQLIDTLNDISSKNKFVQGFTVQVYNGRSREKAFKMKEKVYSLNLDLEPSVNYVQPNFKVKIGQYLERVEAIRIQNKLSAEISSAIVIPDRIYLK